MSPVDERWHVVCRTCDDLEDLAPTEDDADDAAAAHQDEHPDHVVRTAPVTQRARRVATDGGLDVEDVDTCEDCGRDLRVRDHGHSCPRRSVACEGCGSYVPQRATKEIDVSPPDEYYPRIVHICPNCTVDDDQEVATDGGIDVDVEAAAPDYARIVDARLARDDQTGAWQRARDETVLTERVGGPGEERTHVVAFRAADGAHDVTLVDVEPDTESRRYLAACDCVGFRSGDGADAVCSHVLAVAREHVLRDHYVPDPGEFVGASASAGGEHDDGLRADGGTKSSAAGPASDDETHSSPNKPSPGE